MCLSMKINLRKRACNEKQHWAPHRCQHLVTLDCEESSADVSIAVAFAVFLFVILVVFSIRKDSEEKTDPFLRELPPWLDQQNPLRMEDALKVKGIAREWLQDFVKNLKPRACKKGKENTP